MLARLSLSFLLLALAAPAPAAPVPKRPPVPIISTTSQSPEYQAAETRLALFIRALQRGNRRRAVSLMSSRVTAAERRALVENRWLRKETGRRGSFEQILFVPDLSIRTRSVYRDTVKLAVVPRKMYRKKQARFVGIMEVRMRKEGGKWWVELRPDNLRG
jgi:hypothetical protein